MIDFSKLEKCNIHDFRRALYLSKRNAPILKDLNPLTLNFTSDIKTFTHNSGPFSYFETAKYPISKEIDFFYKLLLSRSLRSIEDVEKNIQTLPFEQNNFGDLDLQPIEYVFPALCFTISNDKIILEMRTEHSYSLFLKQFTDSTPGFTTSNDKITVEMRVEHFDSLFLKQFADTTHKITPILYKQKKFAKIKEAIKNQIWLYAASGDALELAFNLTPCRQTLQKASQELLGQELVGNFLQENYKGRNLMQAMDEAHPQWDLPFGNYPSHYDKALTVLLELGQFDVKQKNSSNEEGKLLESIKQYRRKNITFFAPPQREQPAQAGNGNITKTFAP